MRFRPGKALSENLGEISGLREGRDLLQERYLEKHQHQTELWSNSSVLIQEHNQRIFYKARLFKPKTRFETIT